VTKDDYLRIARESGASEFKDGNFAWLFYETEIIAFASTIAALEREECAKVCDEVNERRRNNGMTNGFNAIMDCKEAIRNKDTK
jgi:hypothetical protein